MKVDNNTYNINRSAGIESYRDVAIDIETTGFSPALDKIIELGAVEIKNGEIVETFSLLHIAKPMLSAKTAAL